MSQKHNDDPAHIELDGVAPLVWRLDLESNREWELTFRISLPADSQHKDSACCESTSADEADASTDDPRIA